MGLTAGLGRSPGGENGNPLHYFYLGNPMDRGAWVTKVMWGSDKTEHAHTPQVLYTSMRGGHSSLRAKPICMPDLLVMGTCD